MSLSDKSPATSVHPVSSSSSLTAIPTFQFNPDVEKAQEKCDDERLLINYVVPVLEKGVKTALQKPTSPWVRFRIWFNPYRMVSHTVLARVTYHEPDTIFVALHVHIHPQYGRHRTCVPP